MKKKKIIFIILVVLVLSVLSFFLYPWIYLLQPLPKKVEFKKDDPYICTRLFSGSYCLRIFSVGKNSTKTIFLENEVKIFTCENGKKEELKYPYYFSIKKDFSKIKFYIGIKESEMKNDFYYSIMLKP